MAVNRLATVLSRPGDVFLGVTELPHRSVGKGTELTRVTERIESVETASRLELKHLTLGALGAHRVSSFSTGRRDEGS
jgi:hypothetical protein